jgi:FXSXX-COOH protein
MVPTEELRPAYSSAMADLRDIPLAEMPALGLDELERTIGRVLPGASPAPLSAGTFQSSI